MKDFLEWPGWSGVSAIAQILALGTVVVAASRWFAQRRQFPPVHFTWDLIGNRRASDGHLYHVVEFVNAGRAPASIHTCFLFGGAVYLEADFRAPRVVAPGASFRLLVTSRDIEQAWFQILWQTVSNKNRVHALWGPLQDDGKLGRQSETEWREWKELPLVPRAWRRFKGDHVGPGGLPRASFKLTKLETKRSRRIMHPPPEAGDGYSAFPGASPARQLPYVTPQGELT